jgi:hypothetical protein
VKIVTHTWEHYDNVHNREADHLSWAGTKNGKTTKYTVDVVMMDNKTYHRSSKDTTWQVTSGYGYADALTGTRWARSSLNFNFLLKQSLSGQTQSGGTITYTFKEPLPSSTTGHASYQVTVTLGHNPYIVTGVQKANVTSKGVRIIASSVTNLSGFDSPISITAPATST